jgi:hypothetical protein
MAGEIYGSHSGGYEEFYLLGYNAMSPAESKPKVNLHLQGQRISQARTQCESRWQSFILRRQHVPSKSRLTFSRLHGVISQMTELLVTGNITLYLELCQIK